MSDFEKAAEEVKQLVKSPGDDEKLKLYGLFKQATKGDCDTSRPGMFDPTGRYKWDAWDSRKAMSKDDAEKEYVALVTELKAKYN